MAIRSIVCKSCGANDFSENNGLYVCKMCGTKHVLSEDGNTYNIYVDGMPLTMEEQYVAARTAYNIGDYQQSLQLYSILNKNYRMHWEPVFFIKLIYFLTFTSNTDFKGQCDSFIETLPALFELIKQNYDVVDRHSAIIEISSEFRKFYDKLDKVFDERDLQLRNVKSDALTSNEEIAKEINDQCSRRYEAIMLANGFRNYILANFSQDNHILSIAYDLIRYIVNELAAYYDDFHDMHPETEGFFWQSFELLNDYDKSILYRRYGIKESCQTTFSCEAKPAEHTENHSVLKWVIGLLIFGMLIKGCFGEESKVITTNNRLTKQIAGATLDNNTSGNASVPIEIELITRNNSPKLFSLYETNKAFYKHDSDKLVSFNGRNYKDSTVLNLEFSKKYQIGEDYQELKDIQIYPFHFTSGNVIDLKDALKIVDHFMPWEHFDKYCQIDKNGSMHYTSKDNSDEYYVINYSLLPKYRLDSAKVKNGNATVVIETDNYQRVKYIRIVSGYFNPTGRNSSYKGENWKPEGFHKLPDPPKSPNLLSFVKENKLPKIHCPYIDIYNYGIALGEEYSYIDRGRGKERFGDRGERTLLYGETREIDGKEKLFDLTLYFKRKEMENKVSLEEAIKICDSMLDKDLLHKYYKLLFSKKRIVKKISKYDNDYARYEVTYALNVTTENRKEIIAKDCPDNISIKISQGYDGEIASLSVNCFRYIAPTIKNSEEGVNEKGEMIEIIKSYRKLGPYEESPDSWYRTEYWDCPF